eukprot:TRINITY_DN1750_c0_g3_i2.p1 TRINITY_DN1750_c0_g3~~TRINITY_DN1750_c0_g3_i2.p1  ORF type:complete len:228 (-),score=44.99 TRINITY_DN1750_c0_g3_i2:119-802(-)
MGNKIFMKVAIVCLVALFACAFAQEWAKTPTATDRTTYLASHNTRRNLQAGTGLANVAASAKATNMIALKFYQAAETAALAWARTKPAGHSVAGTTYRATYNGQSCGENIYTYMTSANISANASMWEAATKAWFDEYLVWGNNASNSLTSYAFVPAVGHYTQVVWALTSYLGCGSHTYFASPWYTHKVVCQYCPPGNFQTRPVFAVGTPAASVCPAGKSATYANLCA